MAALDAGQATLADWYDDLLGVRGEGSSSYSRDDFDSIHQLTKLQPDEKRPDLVEALNKIRQRLIEIELARGDAATPATRPALKLSAVFGIDLLLKLLQSLGKTGFKAAYPIEILVLDVLKHLLILSAYAIPIRMRLLLTSPGK